MNNPQKVYAYLKGHPKLLICDDCVEKGTGVNRHQVNTITSTLALFPDEFRRVSALCSQHCSDREKESTAALH